MILKITKMSHNDFAIFIYDECEKCEMPKNPYHDKHGCPKEVEAEDLDICGETGREFDCGQSRVKGCGKKITEDDENIMIGNISYCCECGEKEECAKCDGGGTNFCDCNESEEEVGNCGSCDIELDHLRDGTTEDEHRCSDCYWTETIGYIPK